MGCRCRTGLGYPEKIRLQVQDMSGQKSCKYGKEKRLYVPKKNTVLRENFCCRCRTGLGRSRPGGLGLHWGPTLPAWPGPTQDRAWMGQGRVWQGVGPGRGDLRVPTFETFVGIG